MFRSIDDGASYGAVRDLDREAIVGVATTALGSYAGGNTVDEINAVDVQLLRGELSTITQELLLNNGNAAYLGGELIQFKRAELVAALTYRLTGLLRGRAGTEQLMATHAAGDHFVLLTTSSIVRESASLALIGVPSVLKGVTLGTALSDAYAVEFTNSGAGAKPLSPVHLTADDVGGGEYRIEWVRRTRIGPQWRDYVDVPLGESSEQYRVEVWSSDVLVSAVTVTSPTADVVAGAGDVVRVAQLSDLVGPGFYAELTLT